MTPQPQSIHRGGQFPHIGYAPKTERNEAMYRDRQAHPDLTWAEFGARWGLCAQRACQIVRKLHHTKGRYVPPRPATPAQRSRWGRQNVSRRYADRRADV